jgi:rubrerythrin
MLSLKGSRTEENMRCALSGEVRSNRRYFSYARAAEADGDRDLAAQLRATAESAAHQAFGHLDYLFADGDAAASKSGGITADRPMPAAAALTQERAAMYAGMVRTAHHEGFGDIADWFEILAKAGRSQARRLRRALDTPGHNVGASVDDSHH